MIIVALAQENKNNNLNSQGLLICVGCAFIFKKKSSLMIFVTVAFNLSDLRFLEKLASKLSLSCANRRCEKFHWIIGGC